MSKVAVAPKSGARRRVRRSLSPSEAPSLPDLEYLQNLQLRAEAERQRAEAERQRAERLAQRLHELGANPDEI